MKKRIFASALAGGAFFCAPLSAAVLTVTTANNASPGAGVSLAQALAQAQSGDEIQFNIPGAGPHYIVTPEAGYPEITVHNLTINGYSQPGSSPNSNPILAPNNANIRIYLDSRGGGGTVLNYDGFGVTESAILGVVGGNNFKAKGLGFLAQVASGSSAADPAIYCVAFARGASGGHIEGCRMGVDANGATVNGANAGVAGFRYRDGDTGATSLVNDVVVGVKPASAGGTNAPSQFNVIAGMEIPIIIEGANLRVSGNFIGVLPSGTNDYVNALAGLPNQGAIQVGRDGDNTLIGTDGDGVDDANERNIFGGVVPSIDGVIAGSGYDRIIEFYPPGAKQNVVITGNYFGVGVDGQTRFTNAASIVSSPLASTRFGSDFDGVSDALEGNVVYNHYPASLFTDIRRPLIETPGVNASVSVRGNTLVNNYEVPVDTISDPDSATNYYAKALVDAWAGLRPEITSATATRLEGTVPAINGFFYFSTVVDVYAPDGEGLTNFVEAPGAGLQGRTYLDSFREGGTNDLNPEAGAFAFDIAALGLAQGSKLVVTANYFAGEPGAHNAETLTSPFSLAATVGAGSTNGTGDKLAITRSGNALSVTWPGAGTLQGASAVVGPWTNVTGAASPYNVTPAGAGAFFRLRQ